MITTKAELITAVQSYAKRPGQLATEIDEYFIPIAESRIGRDVRAMENERFQEFVDQATNDWGVPSDFGSIIELSYTGSGGGRVTLYSESLPALSQYRTSGVPNAYSIQNGTIRVRPFQQRTFQLWYYARPDLDSGQDNATALLERFPQLYIQAVLVELYLWARNEQELRIALEAYRAEVREINKQAGRARAAAPAARKI